MTRTIMILLAGFLLTLAAGGVLGRIATPSAKTSNSGPDGGWLAQQLQLSSDQRAQVQAIWDQTHNQMDSHFQQHRDVDREFQQDVLNMLTPDEKLTYNALQQKAIAKANAIDGQVQGIIDTSIQKTKEILTPDQKQKYEQLLARFPAHHPDGGADHLGLPPGAVQPLTSFDPQ